MSFRIFPQAQALELQQHISRELTYTVLTTPKKDLETQSEALLQRRQAQQKRLVELQGLVSGLHEAHNQIETPNSNAKLKALADTVSANAKPLAQLMMPEINQVKEEISNIGQSLERINKELNVYLSIKSLSNVLDQTIDIDPTSDSSIAADIYTNAIEQLHERYLEIDKTLYTLIGTTHYNDYERLSDSIVQKFTQFARKIYDTRIPQGHMVQDRYAVRLSENPFLGD